MTLMTRICDFCSSPDVAWSYPAQTFEIREDPELVAMFGKLESVEAWLACVECARLIDANDRRGLAQRALDCAPALQAAALSTRERSQLFQLTMALHDQFFSARRGPAEPIGVRA